MRMGVKQPQTIDETLRTAFLLCCDRLVYPPEAFMSDATAQVHLEILQHVGVITLDDTRRKNAMSPELGDALSEVVAKVRANRHVRAVVLTGAGDTFSAGGDLKMLERLRTVGFKEARDFMLGFYARYLCVTEIEVPVVAAVQGAAIGAGLCVALACDVCVGDVDTRLALNFSQLGLHPGMGATYLVPRRVGTERAAELLLTGRRFTGAEAVAMGLFLEATPTGQCRERAIAIATQIAANAPLTVRALKKTFAVDQQALQTALEREAFYQAESYGSRDLGEGLAAAAARRPALFDGT
jgi:enoyl-CoA hydratase